MYLPACRRSLPNQLLGANPSSPNILRTPATGGVLRRYTVASPKGIRSPRILSAFSGRHFEDRYVFEAVSVPLTPVEKERPHGRHHLAGWSSRHCYVHTRILRASVEVVKFLHNIKGACLHHPDKGHQTTERRTSR
jgi:hypothetical protein